MRSIFRLADRDRHDLIAQTASAMGVNPVIVEKDVWVCAVLETIFTSDDLRDRFVFKGGTSLSKAFGAIERFSEDVDLIMDWRLLGYGASGVDPWASDRSKTQQAKLADEINAACRSYLESVFAPWLATQLEDCSGSPVGTVVASEPVVELTYPALFRDPYLPGRVVLEIGPLAAWVPSSWMTIEPYVRTRYPRILPDARTDVRVTSPERTFWEKATILHQQAHSTARLPPRYARHYYDVIMLARSGVAQRALSDLALLEDVVAFKEKFYWSAGARYDLATSGTLRLLPPREKLTAVRRDYAAMQVMFFSDPPPWEEIVEELSVLETLINDG